MKEEEQIAKAFYIESKSDLMMAELAYKNSIYSRCVSMSQQVVEKSLKSALAIVGVFVRQHEVSTYFANEFREIVDKEIIKEIVNLSSSVEEEWIRSRYPIWERKDQPVWIPSREYTENDAKKALCSAQRIYELIKDILESKFHLEL